ncbi:hypothetical protein EHH44_08595 [Mycolicibacter terrae]|uniref:Uncharacterized protein n=2 Tax=Mycolicibacter TaxID=1073531 RepID=A0A1A2P0R5_MYCSD|nr:MULTISPECIES: hypothetical protein [Mycolicibacter]OBH20919.1 hypothetical protein A5694_14645 [Mycolicibacter sinensis]OBI33606.1 hypothetical protein A5710_13275 [Mycolicibacter sinensis]RRR45931.1 hypothetical protein EHH44_08595 [Mycolicibacter terrae]
MPSWRDTVTEQAQADLDGLADAAVDFALESIAASGEFLPFALAVSVDGDREVIAPNYPTSAELTVVEQLAAHWRAVTEVKDSLRAAAVALNVTLTERRCDGIEISVEHREGAAIGLIFPYTIGADGAAELESPSAHAMSPRIWGA